MSKNKREISDDDTVRISDVLVCCSLWVFPFPTSVMFTLSLERKAELKQKAKRVRGGGSRKGGGTKGMRRRRNSLVKEFKWNDEKKLEGRTGWDKTGFRVGEREGGKDFGGERSVTLNILHWGERGISSKPYSWFIFSILNENCACRSCKIWHF